MVYFHESNARYVMDNPSAWHLLYQLICVCLITDNSVGVKIAKMERLELTFDSEEGQAIVYGDSDEFEIISNEINSTSRWSIHKTIVVKRLSDGLFFQSHYSEGATESQDESPYEYSDAVFKQVVPLEKTVIYYGWDNR